MAASKSISNRALIIAALCPTPCHLKNLSTARDTLIMKALLAEDGGVLDVQDAGTTMRFLTAYLALSNKNKRLTGTARMQQRPIKILVDALNKLGAEISYSKNEGYPPLDIKGFGQQLTNELSIPGNVSSQYISALLMMAPVLKDGLKLRIEGKLMSEPYVRMTLRLMEWFGVNHQWEDRVISVLPQTYQGREFTVESDWSAASYWYSVVALSQQGEITLAGLQDDSLQGDRQIAEMMLPLGVQSVFHENGVTLTRVPREQQEVSYDFASCPDLGQTVMALCAVIGVSCRATGLESLRIKETDRIFALQEDLGKLGARLIEKDASWELVPTKELPETTITFHTYEDHRMAMALAPLALRIPLVIEEPDVVHKSYPGFWDDLAIAGLTSTSLHPNSGSSPVL